LDGQSMGCAIFPIEPRLLGQLDRATVCRQSNRCWAIAIGAFGLVPFDQAAARHRLKATALPCGSTGLSAIGDCPLVYSRRERPSDTYQSLSYYLPWTLSAEGSGFYEPSKAAAVNLVCALCSFEAPN
jgi:hypothetical protein